MTLDELQLIDRVIREFHSFSDGKVDYYKALEVVGREIKLKTTDFITNEPINSNKPQSVKCPECGGEMISRINRTNNTRFWGCKSYPQCKGTRDSMGRSKEERHKENYGGNSEVKDHEDVGPDSVSRKELDKYRWRR